VEILGKNYIIELGLSHNENAVRPRQSAWINTAGKVFVRGNKERARGKPVSDRKIERQGGD
jgi:alpha-tubulin suppressor-like RCC1 family protein